MFRILQNIQRNATSFTSISSRYVNELRTLTTSTKHLSNSGGQQQEEANFGYEKVKYEEKQTKGL